MILADLNFFIVTTFPPNHSDTDSSNIIRVLLAYSSTCMCCIFTIPYLVAVRRLHLFGRFVGWHETQFLPFHAPPQCRSRSSLLLLLPPPYCYTNYCFNARKLSTLCLNASPSGPLKSCSSALAKIANIFPSSLSNVALHRVSLYNS